MAKLLGLEAKKASPRTTTKKRQCNARNMRGGENRIEARFLGGGRLPAIGVRVYPIPCGAIDFFALHCTEPTSRDALQRK
jgi:hypothetical protein